MSWTIDTPVRVGAITVAAIVETELSIRTADPGSMGVGTKRPLLLLLARGNEISAIDMNAHPYEAEEIEYLYPEAIARMRLLLRDLVPEQSEVRSD
ncbi:hypothetical protein [Yoonia maritima]|uniref:hypothetical protein n=1 Tax=Yoonia maritima TaxID=1435347 RepID=UPI003735D242